MTNWKSGSFSFVASLLMTLGPIVGTAAAHGPNGHEAEAPVVYIINLEDGQTVESPFPVLFGLKHYGVAPAGIDIPGTGHHHLLVNATLSDDERAYAIPADDNHIHFGKGQTETVLDLAPGTYSLQLVLGDANHVPFDPSIESRQITITVE